MPRYRILVVDDSKVVHELARMALETLAGWDVCSAESGVEALELAASARPDAILLDVEMPDMDGPATVAALRARPASATTPIVFLTGHDDPQERSRLAVLAVDGVLSKPFDVSALAGEVAEVLGWPR
ncbi:MAG TPA: response regulator [Conexibacter sp.]|jgi:CheY-like chemotaxis protein|nr:response regulator [Conexibacter sp.]